MNREIISCSFILVFIMDLLLAPCSQAAPAASRALRAAAAQEAHRIHIQYDPETSLTDMVQGEETLIRKRRHAESEAGFNLDLAEDQEIVGELRKERRRSRRSTVMLALTMALKQCEHVRSLCDVEYEEGNKKVRLRIADE